MKNLKEFLVVLTTIFYAPICLGQFTGINTNTPYSRLHVNGTAWFQGDNTPLNALAGSGIAIGFSSGGTGGYIFSWNYASFTARNLWLQHPGGSVLIGSTTSPLAKLDVRTTSQRGIYVSASGSEAVYGTTSSGNGITGVSSTNVGVYGVSTSSIGGGVLGEGNYIGIQGTNKGADVNRQGVRGENSGSAGGYAGTFVGGTTAVFGTLTKNAGAFLIDHPLEPETKYLYHSFVESPDMKNIYDGVVVTDGSGLATVTMPDWFSTLNKDFRYQLTCIGQFAQAIVLQEMIGNQFVIKTDLPHVKVCWQVTGIRDDPYARENRIPTEKLKRPDEIGKYIYPQGYGKDAQFLLDILKPTNFGNYVQH